MTSTVAQEAAVRALGYTSREAAFLTHVARHSGYFVRRQFLEWIGRQQGQTVVDFTERLVSRRHATMHTFCRTTHVYHLSAKPLFEGLDAGPSLRRRRPAVSIKARLMALDVIALRPEVTFLATEAERLAWCDVVGLRRECVPRRTIRAAVHLEGPRYFPDGALIGGQQDVSGPVLVCAYIDDGPPSTLGFQSYLRRYARLLTAPPKARLIHGSLSARSANAAVGAVRQAFDLDALQDVNGTSTDVGTVRDYFHLRRAYEAQDWTALDTAKLDRFRVFRLRFKMVLDALYARWAREGDAALSSTAAPRLDTIVLPHSYAAIEARRRRS